MKYIKNIATENYSFLGQTILAGEYYGIPSTDLAEWAGSDEVIYAITQGILRMAYDASGENDITSSLESINYLQNEMPSKITVVDQPSMYPFAKKTLEDGKKLYRRKHGLRQTCVANETTVIELMVPYAHCKIDEVEIVGCDNTDDVDLLVLDTENGDIQLSMGVPEDQVVSKAVLNQFGFRVALSDMFYSDSSNYDADLYYGMFVKVLYYNNSDVDKSIGINVVLHEVK